MKLLLTALVTLSFLTACTQGTSRALPHVVEYSKETQREALKELQTQDVPTLKEFMKDYKVMRDQTRSLKK